jgi:hypothetical protein
MTTGSRGTPRGSGRVVADEDLPAFAEKIRTLKAEGLSLSVISERLSTPVSTIVHRLVRLKKLLEEKTS